jgi:hypothetical protein
VTEPETELDVELVGQVEQKAIHLLSEIKRLTQGKGDETAIAREMRQDLETILQLSILDVDVPLSGSPNLVEVTKDLRVNLDDDVAIWGSLFGWCFVHSLGKVAQEASFDQQSRSWIDEWLLGKIMAGALADFGLSEPDAWRAVAVIKLLTTHQRWFERKGPQEKRAYQVLEAALQDAEIQQFIQVNRWQGALWFNKEMFERWLWWMLVLAVVDARRSPSADEAAQRIVERHAVIADLVRAEEKSEYQIEKLLEAIQVMPGKSPGPDKLPMANTIK